MVEDAVTMKAKGMLKSQTGKEAVEGKGNQFDDVKLIDSLVHAVLLTGSLMRAGPFYEMSKSESR